MVISELSGAHPVLFSIKENFLNATTQAAVNIGRPAACSEFKFWFPTCLLGLPQQSL